MLRSRLSEFTRRVAREDMLTLFSHTSKLEEVELSVVMDPMQLLSDSELKYRVGCFMVLIGGNVPSFKQCTPYENPLHRDDKDAESKRWNMLKNALIKQSGGKKANSTQLAKAGAEFSSKQSHGQLKSHLHKTAMWSFLEKLREFYLPDFLDLTEEQKSSSKKPVERLFVTRTPSKNPAYPPYQLIKNRNPSEALAIYTISTGDLIKFPDIEENFEHFGDLFSKESKINLVLRAKCSVESRKGCENIDKLKLMNYMLAIYFNPYMNRVVQ